MLLDNIEIIVALILLSTFIFYHLYLVLHLLSSKREVTSIYSWLLVINLLPGIGMIIYILFGRYKKEFNIMDTRSKSFIDNDLSDIFTPLLEKQKEYLKLIENKHTAILEKKIARLSQSTSSALITFNNNINVFQTGESKFAELLLDLESASKFIHMEYFIWRDDELTKEVFKVLKHKAEQGVKVRIIYDAVGSFFFSLNWKLMKELRNSGIEIHPFLRVTTVHAWNYRNHRKIVVIDGEVGYIGGMNMGMEYIDGGEYFDRWSDTHIRIQGDGVNLLQRSFAISWHITTGQSLEESDFRLMNLSKPEGTPVQILLSGPDSDNEAIKQLFFGLITSATKTLYIQTPYFIPDSAMLEALEYAINAGTEVKIMFTGVPDKKVAWWAATPYLRSVVETGGKVYMYNRGFLHSKVIVADGCISTVGTANFDIRSFRIDYEINGVIYDVEISKRLENDFENDLKYCNELTLDYFESMNSLVRLRSSLCKLLSPLL
jgi:cardiolipin synthase A/B